MNNSVWHVAAGYATQILKLVHMCMIILSKSLKVLCFKTQPPSSEGEKKKKKNNKMHVLDAHKKRKQETEVLDNVWIFIVIKQNWIYIYVCYVFLQFKPVKLDKRSV